MIGLPWELVLGLMGGALVLLMGLGVPVAFAFLAINLVGAWFILGGPAGMQLLARNATEAIGSFVLIPIPLFVLMGEILLATGLATQAIRAIEKGIAGVPGRLSLVAISSGTVFASLSGSSIANTAVLGRVLLPEMTRLNYHPTVSIGPILGIGGVAMLIPPSALAVLLGSLAGLPISQLLIAGILPGLLLAALYFAYVIIACAIKPSLAPSDEVERIPLGKRLKVLATDVLPLLLIVVVVVGSILGGFATPSESAALGCVATVIAALVYRRFSIRALAAALMGTVRTSALILIIISGSITFSQILSFSGASRELIAAVTAIGLEPLHLVAALLLVALLLGMLMDQLSIMLITLPFFIPLVESAGVDPIWFAVMMLVALEVGLVTPPFGLLLFIMQSVAPEGTSMRAILISVVPFVALELIGLSLIFAFPAIALWLPSLL